MNELKTCTKCKIEKPISEFTKKNKNNIQTTWCKKCLYSMQIERWEDRKRKAIDLLGGCCAICGHNEYYSVLHFHHLDPLKKLFTWSKLKLQTWEVVITELKKCILLCGNCHLEHHHPELYINGYSVENSKIINNALVSTGNCHCGKELFGTKFCSISCLHNCK